VYDCERCFEAFGESGRLLSCRAIMGGRSLWGGGTKYEKSKEGRDTVGLLVGIKVITDDRRQTDRVREGRKKGWKDGSMEGWTDGGMATSG